MKIEKIMILGSTLLTEKAITLLKNHYNLIGFVPSKNPTVKGVITLPEVNLNIPCDIKLSIQYDKIIKNTYNTFNVHTGLLPKYGGTNLLDYTLKNRDHEQGITFHKMTDEIDYGPIISKISYPVFQNDKAIDLYKRLLTIGPMFILSSLKLLESLNKEEVDNCYKETPTIYKRGEFTVSKEILNI